MKTHPFFSATPAGVHDPAPRSGRLRPIHVGNAPFAVAVNEAAGTVYVTNFTDGTVSVITN